MTASARRHGLVEVGTSCVRTLLLDLPSGRPPADLDGLTVEQSERYTFCGKALLEGQLHRSSTPWKQTLAAVVEFSQGLRQRGAVRGVTMATHAVRRCTNRRDVVADLEKAGGWPVRVLGGPEEARLTARGCLAATGEGGALVTDVGGGSTEVVLAEGSDPAGWECFSMPLGTQLFTKQLGLAGVCPEPADRLLPRVEAQLRSLWPRLPRAESLPWISTGGSALGLGVLTRGKSVNSLSDVEGAWVEVSEVGPLLSSLLRMDVGARDRQYHLGPGRSEQIASGALLHMALARSLGRLRFRCSAHDARYGLLLELAEEGTA